MRKPYCYRVKVTQQKQPMCLQLTSGSGEQTFQRRYSYGAQRGGKELVPAIFNDIVSWICERLQSLAEKVCCVKGKYMASPPLTHHPFSAPRQISG